MDLRDIFILTSIVVIAIYSLRTPQVGLLGWLWVSIMVPHKMAFGFVYNMPLLDGLVACTVISCIVNWKDRAPVEFHPILKVLIAFYAWCCLTTLFAVNQPAAYYKWIEVSKTFLLVMLLLLFMNRKHWIIACFSIYVLSVGFTAIKGGLFTVIGGGGSRVWGPPGGMWSSNNGVALVMSMSIPVFLGFAPIFGRKLFRLGVRGTALLAFFAVLGTQSRGGLVGLVAVGGAMIVRSQKKMLAFVLVSVMGVGGFFFMPEGWHNRMATILTPSEEGSASTRLVQWQYAIDISLQRPLFGNGFDTFFHRPYYYRFVGDKDSNRAVHSNIFQVLGEQGYIGLAMYLAMWVMLVLSSKKYALLCKDRKDLLWAASLVGMMQFSVVGFAANGLTLNLAYLDLYFFILVFTVLLISHIREELGLKSVGHLRGQNAMVPRSRRK